MPSRPVFAPTITSRSPWDSARADITRPSSMMPTHITLTSGFSLNDSLNSISPPTFGTPMQLP